MQEQNLEESQQQQPIDEKPEYGQVDGEIIKLGGLDYNLIQQQQTNKNENLLSKIKDKLNIISGNVLSRKMEQQKMKAKAVSKQDIKMYESLKSVLGPKQNAFRDKRKWKGKAHSAYFYEFDMDPQYGRKYPNIVEKRLGKVEIKEVFINFQEDFITQLSKLLEKKDIEDKSSQQIEEGHQIDAEDSDDIFAETAPKGTKKIDIQIGKKLQFGFKDNQDIFQSYDTYKRPGPLMEPIIAQKQENDKYFFMRKPAKRANMGQNLEDGYGECYEQNGPSLKELVEMKKQGIEYFGEEKQFKKKQRKPNLNKDYEKIQRIIQQKHQK